MKYYTTPKSPEHVGKLFLEIAKHAIKAEKIWRTKGKTTDLFRLIDRIEDALDQIQTPDSYIHNETKNESDKCYKCNMTEELEWIGDY